MVLRVRYVLSLWKSRSRQIGVRYDLLPFNMLMITQSEIKFDGQGGYYEVTRDGQTTKLQEASISLNDCLACRYESLSLV